MVNVSCLPRLFSKRFGGLISIMQLIPRATAKHKIKLINMPDQIAADVKPTQSYASLKRLAPAFNCTWNQENKDIDI